MEVQWIGTYKWTGEHPNVGAKRTRRCRIGFEGERMVIANRGFHLLVPLSTMRSVHFKPQFRRSTLRFTADGGIDITLRETSSDVLDGIVLYRIQAAIS
jgi:hypothetical protein